MFYWKIRFIIFSPYLLIFSFCKKGCVIHITIKNFINLVCKKLKIKITWRGKGINERAYDENGNVIIKIDKNYFRPTEVDTLLGDASKARKILKWKPKTNIKELVKEMVNAELKK